MVTAAWLMEVGLILCLYNAARSWTKSRSLYSKSLRSKNACTFAMAMSAKSLSRNLLSKK